MVDVTMRACETCGHSWVGIFHACPPPAVPEVSALLREVTDEHLAMWGELVRVLRTATRWWTCERLGALDAIERLIAEVRRLRVSSVAPLDDAAVRLGPTWGWEPDGPQDAHSGPTDGFSAHDAIELARTVLSHLNDWATMDPAAEPFGWIANETAAALRALEGLNAH